jgi:hypothetical protein
LSFFFKKTQTSKGLAFHPSGQLWGGSDQGLLQIDTDTAVGTVLGPTPPGSINSLAWNHEGTQLFATTKTPPHASTLWVYDDSNDWRIACEGLGTWKKITSPPVAQPQAAKSSSSLKGTTYTLNG